MSINEQSKRITVSLKPDTIEILDKLAKEWGTTRSGMITILAKLRVDHDHSEMLADAFKER